MVEDAHHIPHPKEVISHDADSSDRHRWGGVVMRAAPGDEIVLAAAKVDGPTRQGEVLEVRGPDGAPPYLVRWSDGHVGLLVLGAGSVLRVGPSGQAASAATAAPAEPAPAKHVRDWTVRVSIFEGEPDTSAEVELLSDSPMHLTAHGASHLSPGDRSVPAIGDEVAVARALHRLADQLLETASRDIASTTGEEDVVLRSR
jgi:hypothetical protein